MDTEFFKKFFCCLFPLAARRRKETVKTEISAPLKRPRRIRTVVGSGSDRYQKLLWLHSCAFYSDLKRKILDDISYDRTRTLIVWYPQDAVPNDYIVTMLHQYGEINNFIDNFSRMQYLSKNRVWYGTVVEYSTVEDALTAYKDVPLQCRYMKVLPLAFILSILVDCELLVSGFGRESASTVVVSGRRSMNTDKTFYLYLELTDYGKIQKLLFDHRRTTSGVICKVTYSYFTHAYLARMMLHGQNYDEVCLTAEIEEEEKEDVIEEAKKCLMMAIESYF